MSFTDFYAESATGSNLNAGSTTSGTPTYTSAAGDSDGTSVFTPNDGSTPASTVSTGMWGSVYVTAGATVATFIGRISTVAAGVNGAITFSTTAKSGTFPAASAGAHTITCIVGGVLKGPNGTSGFPFNFITAAQMDSSSNMPRVNFKGTFNITAAVTHTLAGPVRFQGMAGSAGDLGKFTLDGGTSTIVPLAISGADISLMDYIVSNNGTSGTNAGINWTGSRGLMERGVVHDIRSSGVTSSSGNPLVRETEFYLCNTSNTASQGGANAGSVVFFERCIFHDIAGSNGNGIVVGNNPVVTIDCIFDTNAGQGIECTGNSTVIAKNCDFYNHTGSGIRHSSTSAGFFNVENCNFIKNTVGGVIVTGGTAVKAGRIINCGFGTGTQANGTDVTTNSATVMIEQQGTVTYAADVTPWTDPANGDFRISLAAAQGVGRGTFTQTAASYSGTIGYPDIGAAQSQDSTAGGASPFAGLIIT